MEISLPDQFKAASLKETKSLYEDGSKIIKGNGYKSDLNQTTLLFLNKGEFSSLKIKYSPIDREVILDYKNQWKNLNNMIFDILTKEKMAEATLDSISRIEKINGRDFYIFETNIKFLDLNQNKTIFKSVRYSTPLMNSDFVINVSYVNQIDEKEIIDAIKSIKISSP